MVSVTLALLPITAALGFLGLAIVGSRETLFTVVPRADRYKARAFIDTFVYRTGDVVGSQTEGLLGRRLRGSAARRRYGRLQRG